MITPHRMAFFCVTLLLAAAPLQSASAGCPNGTADVAVDVTTSPGLIVRTHHCEDLPPLATVPAAIAAKHPELMREREQLAQRRDGADEKVLNDTTTFNKEVRQLKVDCVSYSSVSFWLSLNQCQRKETIYDCIRGIGASEKALACLATLPAVATPAYLATCGLVALTPLDVGKQCVSMNDVCLTNALKVQKQKTAACLR